jgi:hypothetical protein
VRNWLAPAIQAAIVAVAFFAAVFIFRLGWFFPLVAAVGAAVAVQIAIRWRGPRSSRATAGVGAFSSYIFVFASLVWALVGQSSSRTFDAVWQDRGAGNPYQEAEVFLELVEFPGHGIGVYSTALRDQLAEVGNAPTQIEFVVTSDLGCVRGFRHVRIGSVADPAVINGRGGYARGSSSSWASDSWWCR